MSPSPPDIFAAPAPAWRPSVVFLDLDGTCLDIRDQSVHPRTRDAIRQTVAAGVVVIIASGRMYRSALPHARDLHVVAPLVCYQGALVRALPAEGDPVVDGEPLGRLVFEDPLPAGVALRGLAAARAGGWHRQAYQDDRLICEEDRPEAHMYARIAQVPISFVADLEPLLHAGTTKLVCVVADASDADRCETKMRAAMGEDARVTRSLPEFVEITNPAASKGRALARLCAHLGLPIDQAVAVGDAPNDTDMLAAAGYAVAVCGAPPVLLDVADAVCAPPAEAGVADVLERLGLTAPSSATRSGPGRARPAPPAPPPIARRERG